MKELGGLRPKTKLTLNMGWQNASFRNYADYMQTGDFAMALDEFMRKAAEKSTAIMCAEALPWRCHRSLVGDALIVHGVKVLNIITPAAAYEHTMTRFAEVQGTRITYPKPEDEG